MRILASLLDNDDYFNYNHREAFPALSFALSGRNF